MQYKCCLICNLDPFGMWCFILYLWIMSVNQEVRKSRCSLKFVAWVPEFSDKSSIVFEEDLFIIVFKKLVRKDLIPYPWEVYVGKGNIQLFHVETVSLSPLHILAFKRWPNPWMKYTLICKAKRGQNKEKIIIQKNHLNSPESVVGWPRYQ